MKLDFFTHFLKLTIPPWSCVMDHIRDDAGVRIGTIHKTEVCILYAILDLADFCYSNPENIVMTQI